MGVFELIANLGLFLGREVFVKHLESIFMGYLVNTAAAVRQMGIAKSALLAAEFKQDWIVENYIPTVLKHFSVDKKGYNYRMCCLSSLDAILPYIQKDNITKDVIPLFVQATKDEIPNVRFCVAKILNKSRAYIDPNVFNN